jgi:hypothetical protein
MHTMHAIEFRPRRQDVLLVDGMDHEQHGRSPSRKPTLKLWQH